MCEDGERFCRGGKDTEGSRQGHKEEGWCKGPDGSRNGDSASDGNIEARDGESGAGVGAVAQR